MARTRKVLIVGAGPGGLSAGLALQKAGYAVEILEKTADRAVLGSELHILSPALRALDDIGAANRVVAAGVAIDSYYFCSTDGAMQTSVPLHKATRNDLPVSVGITRNELHRAIYESATGLKIPVHHDVTVDSIVDDDDDGIRIVRSDGVEGRYDFLVGADGVGSRVRQLRFPDMPAPIYSGQCVWRASVPRTTEAGVFATSSSEGAFVGLVTVSDSESYLFCLSQHATPPQMDATQHAALIREAIGNVGGEFAKARDSIDGNRTIHFAPIWSGIAPLPWTDGRVALIGDAVHTTPPHLAYGAGLAIEDGVVLGEIMRDAPNVAAGLHAFGVRRHSRCALVVETALSICKWQQDSASEFDQPGESARVWAKLTQPY